MLRLRPSQFGRLSVLACLLVALALAGCGSSKHSASSTTTANSTADANNNGVEINAGPVTYQLQISRVLNPYDIEDAEYLKGLPAGTPALTASQQWYGIFLWAKNATEEKQTTTDHFVVEDTVGAKYYPVPLDANVNPFAWTATTLRPGETQPLPNSVASEGPTQGELLLFRVSDTVYSNRPLTLYILGQQHQTLGSISLDL